LEIPKEFEEIPKNSKTFQRIRREFRNFNKSSPVSTAESGEQIDRLHTKVSTRMMLEATQHPPALGKKAPSFMGFGKVAPSPGIKNIDKLKQSSRNLLQEELRYKPKVSQTFLQNWLDYPVDREVDVLYSSFALLSAWLRWTNRAMAGLDPLDRTIRARVCNQLQVLGTTSSLFLVISVASFLVPPSEC
jgi:hypothetical protein